MILNKKDKDLNLVFNVWVDDFDYNLYRTLGVLVHFGCGNVGHLVRACPGKYVPSNNLEQTRVEGGEKKQRTAESRDSASNELNKTGKQSGGKLGQKPT